MKTMQLKMLTILLRWNNMKYSLDNTAYVINDSNCGRLNQIYLKYWKPNGYCFGSGRTVIGSYQFAKAILPKSTIGIIYDPDDKCLYFIDVNGKRYNHYTIKDVNNLIMVE